MSDEKRLSKREARRWVQQHWAQLIFLADLSFSVPEGVDEVWADECVKIADRLGYDPTWRP